MLKKNFFGTEDYGEELLLQSMLSENILINLRTYHENSLVLYANDHFNNFLHLYISNGTSIVYLFNSKNEIKNITVEYSGEETIDLFNPAEYRHVVNVLSIPEVTNGESVQIAIIRGEKNTTLHVNEVNFTLDAVPDQLDSYSNKPWINPEMEVLAPQRPPAPPTAYFQVIIND